MVDSLSSQQSAGSSFDRVCVGHFDTIKIDDTSYVPPKDIFVVPEWMTNAEWESKARAVLRGLKVRASIGFMLGEKEIRSAVLTFPHHTRDGERVICDDYEKFDSQALFFSPPLSYRQQFKLGERLAAEAEANALEVSAE